MMAVWSERLSSGITCREGFGVRGYGSWFGVGLGGGGKGLPPSTVWPAKFSGGFSCDTRDGG